MQIEEFGRVLRARGLASGAGVPCSIFKPLVNYMTVEPGMDYVPAASEGEAVAIAAGLEATGKPAFCLMQNSGLGNAVNPLTSLVWIYGIPVSLFVSLRGEPGRPDEPQHELMGRVTEELARLCGLRTHFLDPGGLDASLQNARDDGVPAAWICRKGALAGGPAAPPLAPRATSRELVPTTPGEYTPRVLREEALRSLLPLLSSGLAEGKAPAVISTTGKLSRELYELDDRSHDRLNRFYMVGSMGCALGFGLGVARGRPKGRVLVLDGDGAVLMKMGTLATVGSLASANLHHLVFDNGAYESTGGQPTSSPTVDLAAVALACGYRRADTVDDPDQLFGLLERNLKGDGPTFIRMVVRTGARKDLGRPSLAPRDCWARFKSYLA